MIDNPDQVARLVPRLRDSLPLFATVTPEVATVIREQSPDADPSRRYAITRVDYAGDEGGIVCKVELGPENDDRALFASITHLRFGHAGPFATRRSNRHVVLMRRTSPLNAKCRRAAGRPEINRTSSLRERGALARGHKMPADRTRSISTSRDAAEAAFKAATTKPAELPPKRPTVPNAKELVSLRIDRDILDHFQEAGPGWQDRINEALRKAAGK